MTTGKLSCGRLCAWMRRQWAVLCCSKGMRCSDCPVGLVFLWMSLDGISRPIQLDALHVLIPLQGCVHFGLELLHRAKSPNSSRRSSCRTLSVPCTLLLAARCLLESLVRVVNDGARHVLSCSTVARTGCSGDDTAQGDYGGRLQASTSVVVRSVRDSGSGLVQHHHMVIQ